jgi:hypothetical protein
MFIHLIYFWLKADAGQAAKEKLIADRRSMLEKIPGVEHSWSGEPAGTQREIVDNSYSVALAVVLPDRAAHDACQKHPLHMEFIARNQPHWQRLRVYDFIG